MNSFIHPKNLCSGHLGYTPAFPVLKLESKLATFKVERLSWLRHKAFAQKQNLAGMHIVSLVKCGVGQVDDIQIELCRIMHTAFKFG